MSPSVQSEKLKLDDLCYNNFVEHLLKTGIHLVPTSSLWAQLWVPTGLAGQSINLASVPVQAVLSSQMGPVPSPKWAWVGVLAPENQVI